MCRKTEPSTGETILVWQGNGSDEAKPDSMQPAQRAGPDKHCVTSRMTKVTRIYSVQQEFRESSLESLRLFHSFSKLFPRALNDSNNFASQ